MENMVDRVALAIGGALARFPLGVPVNTVLARAAIEAMREPPRKMLDAAYKATSATGDYPKKLLSARNKMRLRWEAMIDYSLGQS